MNSVSSGVFLMYVLEVSAEMAMRLPISLAPAKSIRDWFDIKAATVQPEISA
ncbi:hypothetical protein D3C79_1047440 [compost metagenome]